MSTFWMIVYEKVIQHKDTKALRRKEIAIRHHLLHVKRPLLRRELQN